MTFHPVDSYLCWELPEPPVPSADNRAAAGAELLDALDPTWPTYCDAETVDVVSGTRCPLGQRWGSYTRGLAALGLTEADAVAYGFHPTGATEDEAWADAGDLTGSWTRLIEDRRGRSL